MQEQETHLPLPPEILHNREEDGHLFTYSVAAIESTVIKAQHTAEAWTRARVRTPKKLKKGSDGSTLIGLKLLLDRWLVAVYYEGVVHIYDTQPQASFTTGSRHTNPTNLDSHDAAVLRASLVLETNSYTSFSVAIDSTGHRLILALSHPRPYAFKFFSYVIFILMLCSRPHKIDIYQIELLDLSGETPTLNKVFYLIRSIPLPHYKVIQALDVANRVIIISTPGIVDVLKWDEDYNTEVLGRRGAIFRVNIEDIEGLVRKYHLWCTPSNICVVEWRCSSQTVRFIYPCPQNPLYRDPPLQELQTERTSRTCTEARVLPNISRSILIRVLKINKQNL